MLKINIESEFNVGDIVELKLPRYPAVITTIIFELVDINNQYVISYRVRLPTTEIISCAAHEILNRKETTQDDVNQASTKH